MKNRSARIALYLAGPLVVLGVVVIAVSPSLFAPASIPITAPVEADTANLTGLAASIFGALVLCGSLWWIERKADT